jgi:hypothetical protein
LPSSFCRWTKAVFSVIGNVFVFPPVFTVIDSAYFTRFHSTTTT